MTKNRNITNSLVIFLSFVVLTPCVLAQLRVGFYNTTCPSAEQIVKQVVQERFAKDSSITAALLRMHFHDCFVRGCDASILINSTSKKPSEKSAGPNLTVRGFEIIDEAKRRLEAACPSKVSCADIVTLATRDSVFLAGGPKYIVPTGRRDGLVSNPNEVNLPGPTLSVSAAFQSFQAKGLTLNEMVVLLGAHTVGFAHCNFFSDRLSNFQGSGSPDPTMDPALVRNLTSVCAKGTNPKTFLDQNTSFVFDNEFYHQIILNRGVLQIDQELALDSSTSGFVSDFASKPVLFSQRFADTMIKMGKIEVLVGKAGEIRKKCGAFNNPKIRKVNSSSDGSRNINSSKKIRKKPPPGARKIKTTPQSTQKGKSTPRSQD
ncbi:Peroxidase [Parasponia andersonii]|uniref:Peroxidase n=1 Tax=Parasponia andersonii TaxID=3476 RepID=A0A2P5CTX7_PARAD|nr:Peroxidase [Parasponia andersonii]